MSDVTELVLTAIQSGVPIKVARFLGVNYEQVLRIDRNFKNMRVSDIRDQIEVVEARLRKANIYKRNPPFTLRERILLCREIIEATFSRVTILARGKQLKPPAKP